MELPETIAAAPDGRSEAAAENEQLGGALGTDYSTGRPVDKLTDRLDKVRETGRGQWVACCPAHEDRTPSLSIRETEDGKVLVKCHAGCGAADVVGAVGLNLSDLFPDDQKHSKPKRGQRHIPSSVLACCARDATLVMVAAEHIGRGEALSEEDADKLAQAARRLRHAAREGGANV